MWVLGLPGIDYPDDPVKHEMVLAEFHAWQRRKAAWREESTDLDSSAFWRAAHNERQCRHRRGRHR